MLLSAWPRLWGRGVELTSSSISLPVPLHCVLQVHGFVVYHTQLPWDVPEPATLGAPPHSICDRGYVMLQKVRLWEHTSPWDSALEGCATCWQCGCAMPVLGTARVPKAILSLCGVALGPKFPLFWGQRAVLALMGLAARCYVPAGSFGGSGIQT